MPDENRNAKLDAQAGACSVRAASAAGRAPSIFGSLSGVTFLRKAAHIECLRVAKNSGSSRGKR
jgi:hypothetical protein